MLIIETIPILRKYIKIARNKRKSISLVATMGNIHEGHIKLINEAKIRTDIVVVSIFVNPMQFNSDEDLNKYPRTIQEDYNKLIQQKVDIIFVPNISEIYPNGIKNTTYIEVPIISNILEGASRKGHFRGVSTIVSKLFNIIKPDIACFGEKDYQQLVLIRKMVADMGYNINIIGVPIVRAEDGLALSSRNQFLTTNQRYIAHNINKIIELMAKKLKEYSIEYIINFAKNELKSKGFKVSINDIHIRDADTLLELTNISKRAVIMIAAYLGKTRLIDNKVIELNFNLGTFK